MLIFPVHQEYRPDLESMLIHIVFYTIRRQEQLQFDYYVSSKERNQSEGCILVIDPFNMASRFSSSFFCVGNLRV